jgi:hypothetical protein
MSEASNPTRSCFDAAGEVLAAVEASSDLGMFVRKYNYEDFIADQWRSLSYSIYIG